MKCGLISEGVVVKKIQLNCSSAASNEHNPPTLQTDRRHNHGNTALCVASRDKNQWSHLITLRAWAPLAILNACNAAASKC